MRTFPGVVHANGNLICSLDWETTGKVPGHHEIVQVAIVPLDNNLKPLDSIRPFYQNIKPLHPERVEPQAMRTNRLSLSELVQFAPEPGKVADLLREWFEALDLPQSKKLMPLAHNWAFESAFTINWLGDDEKDAIFHPHVRDSMRLATAINDLCAFHGGKLPFPSVSLETLCNKLKVENLSPHDALSDSLATAECYRRLICMLPDLLL